MGCGTARRGGLPSPPGRRGSGLRRGGRLEVRCHRPVTGQRYTRSQTPAVLLSRRAHHTAAARLGWLTFPHHRQIRSTGTWAATSSHFPPLPSDPVPYGRVHQESLRAARM
jgi:hypothetical protein